ncbi:MAG: hypothetical protein U9N40_02140 [Euryarchaeota archaeon]|nr:hypothetical protein [Euryarchaeota archaeon]
MEKELIKMESPPEIRPSFSPPSFTPPPLLFHSRILARGLCFGEITHPVRRFNTESMRVYFPDLSRRRGDAENHNWMMYGSVFLLFSHPIKNTVADRNLQSVLFSGIYDIPEGF